MYADSIQAKFKHYRDSSGREVDAIVELRNGNYAAIEIKIYSDENIKDAFASLKKFEKMKFDVALECCHILSDISNDLEYEF